MKLNSISLTGALLLASALAAPLPAAELGMVAPDLKISQWVKGKPVALKDGKGKNIYVIEFWATWCPPCRTSIPHLSQLQKKFAAKDVVLIGITDEEVGKVKPFVAKMAGEMDYTVAIDQDKQTSENYMGAFKQNGIPHAFIVDKTGAVIWHGHPMDQLEETLEKIVAGKFDLATAKKLDAIKQQEAAAQEKISEVFESYFTAASKGEKGPEHDKQGEEILKLAADQPPVLAQFASIMLKHPQIKTRDLPLALRAAKAAYDGNKSDEARATVADIYARALRDSGKKDEAIKLQKEAIAHAKDAKAKQAFEKTLREYEGKADDKKADK